MADQGKIGTPWNNTELDAIVADYFSMLADELGGRSYVKSHHNAVVMEQTGRTHRSVEFKHQNISAVLEELGLPWIAGYKPKRNYQGAIFPAIDRYLSNYAESISGLAERPSPWLVQETPFVEVPEFSAINNRPPGLERLIRKFDPAERDRHNRSLGKAGEEFVMRVERDVLTRADRSDLAAKVRWVAEEDGDGAGFDILSFSPSGTERLIEVKTTNGSARTPFYLSRNEHETAARKSESWRLYRVHLFAQSPRIFALQPPLERVVHLRTEMWRASFA